MINVMKQSGKEEAYLTEFSADTLMDLADLPKNDVKIGSTCIVIEDSSVWMLGSDLEWHEL